MKVKRTKSDLFSEDQSDYKWLSEMFENISPPNPTDTKVYSRNFQNIENMRIKDITNLRTAK